MKKLTEENKNYMLEKILRDGIRYLSAEAEYREFMSINYTKPQQLANIPKMDVELRDKLKYFQESCLFMSLDPNDTLHDIQNGHFSKENFYEWYSKKINSDFYEWYSKKIIKQKKFGGFGFIVGLILLLFGGYFTWTQFIAPSSVPNNTEQPAQ